MLTVLWAPLPGSNSTWVNHGLPCLHSHPWQTVPARVLRRGRWSSLIEVTDDGLTVFEVRIDPAHLAMITDSVDLVRGRGKWAVLRVPGSRELFPAKVSRPLLGVAEPAAVTESVAGVTGQVSGAAPESATAVAVPVSGAAGVTERWARTLRDRVLLVFAQLVLVWGVGLVGLALVAAHYVGVMWLVFVVVSGVFTALVVGHRGWDLVLPGLVGSGEWVRADAVLGVCETRRGGTARVVVVLRFADGGSREVVLPAASVDLVGAAGDSSSLWVAGNGRRVAVGFPGLPHAAYARVG
ncbi:hypothetical protein [Actinokineospora terrae]|uniref:hypothetical protein n=1 Tax=Actinokineospora terrae TaxID=155974 RepID=UPI001160A67A|nr:hypothetical protein [Actinokineospora terrae]